VKNVNKAIISIIALVIIAPVMLLGCQAAETSSSPAPATPAPSSPAPATIDIQYTSSDFTAEQHIVRDVELVQPGIVQITLVSNPTTGFQWKESAAISNPAIVTQASHEFIPPQTGEKPLAGAAGKEVWNFKALKAGSASISFSYGRSWEGGEKDLWTLILNVTVK
jgi:inhibitor of cysteine peptidase